jgi:hypothetical protein
MVPVMMEMTKRKIKMFSILRSGNGRQTVANPSVWSEKAQTMRRRIRRQSIGVRMVLTRNKDKFYILYRMITAEEFIETNFTEKGLVLKGLPIPSLDEKISVNKISNNSEVAYLRYMLKSDDVELIQITRINKNANATYKGIAKPLMVVLAIEAYKNRKENIILLAAPGTHGDEARKLFKYYSNLGGLATEFNYSTPYWTQLFKFNVIKLLEDNHIELPEQIPIVHVEGNSNIEYVYSTNEENYEGDSNDNINGGSRKTRKTRKSRKTRKYRHTRIRRRA